MSNSIINKDGVPTLQVTDPANLNEYALIDVRRPDEFNAELGHIQGAKLYTLGPELTSFLNDSDKNQKILFICRSGMRSANATLEALKFGYKSVYNMEGGMMGWNEKNYPITRD